jgi:hypothetical protein
MQYPAGIHRGATALLIAIVCTLGFSGAAPAASQIALIGNVLRKCTLDAQPHTNASNLPLTAAGAQRLQIASIVQDCNGRTGYTLDVFSTNCAATPTGAKVIDPVSSEYLSYSVESRNPTTGGSDPVVTGLMATACSGQVARDVSHAIIHNQTSTFYVNFTGAPELGAGIYQDTLTITITAK